ncbi:IS4 family transposase [Azospirillum endophyticum]
MLQRMVECSTVCLRRLAENRVEEMRFGRWLANPKVRLAAMERALNEQIGPRVAGLHVLAIQDTSEINYQAHARRTRGLGTVGNGRDRGLFVHPVLAVDAESGACLGLVGAQVYARTKAADPNYRDLPIESKESLRWLRGALTAKRALGQARQVTVIADRESDIYEEWDRLPGPGFDLLTRSCRDRALSGGGKLFAAADAWPVAGRLELELPARPGKRTERTATVEVRYGAVTVKRPKHGSDPGAAPTVTLRLVEVREAAAPPGEEPVHWRLLTTHAVDSLQDALRIVQWYRRRWLIEQLFRTLKSQGLDVESSQVESAEALKRLIVLALLAATHILQLLGVRDGLMIRPLDDVFAAGQIGVLTALLPSLEGRSAARKNPHPPHTLAWATWIVARLGGWDGYPKSAPPGPITLARGYARFSTLCEGAALAQYLC